MISNYQAASLADSAVGRLRPSRPLRIAQVAATVPPAGDEPGQVCYHNAQGLARLGHTVHLFTPRRLRTSAPAGTDGLTLRRLWPLAGGGLSATLPGLLWQLQGFDIVHLHYPFFGGELAALAARLHHIPLVVTHHHDRRPAGPVGNTVHETVGRAALRSAARLLFPTADYALASTAATWLEGREQVTAELPNGVDSHRFAPAMIRDEWRARYAPAPDDRVVLLVASLERGQEFKGVPIFLQALARLSPEVKGIIVGDGTLRRTYEATARKLGLAGRVHFVGRAPAADLPRYYRVADITVCPSTSMAEAFGLGLIESLASGTPVVASSLPGVRGVVDHGKDGLLVPPGDAPALAAALAVVLRDTPQRRAMGQRGRSKVERYYTWSTIAQRLEGIYCEVLDELARVPLIYTRTPFAPLAAGRLADERRGR